MTDTAGRLLRLLPLLTARPSSRGDELAVRLGVTTRTVRPDIGRLRELGYPVRAVPGPQGGYALGPKAATRAAAALDQVMPSRLRRRVDALTTVTVPLKTAGPVIASSLLASLALACSHGERLRFGYASGSGEESRRHVEPYRLCGGGSRG